MKYFIFYIPGSMGSLLSVLIRSQTEKNFEFNGFETDTAHNHVQKYSHDNTHNYPDYQAYKKSKKDIETHLKENQVSNSNFQLCDVFWCSEFIDYKPAKTTTILCYIDDQMQKLNNFYNKLKEITLKSMANTELNFGIQKDHKHYEKIIFMKVMAWWIREEKKYLNLFPSINMNLVIQKNDYSELAKFVKITDKKLLDVIIKNYNKQQVPKADVFPEFDKFIREYMHEDSGNIQ